MGRTPFLTRTDLLVSHELPIGGRKQMRIELNVINLFNQKTATHIFNFLNKGAPGGGSLISSDAIDLSHVNLAQGYDYNALILATPTERRRTIRATEWRISSNRDGRPRSVCGIRFRQSGWRG